mmetsp:Transcript_103078/g.204664  ORF Transcript_103078/g.204664 Transcript_103078/m.204664 type:complete len:262 (+) Transcript_103078:769-1554(+)
MLRCLFEIYRPLAPFNSDPAQGSIPARLELLSCATLSWFGRLLINYHFQGLPRVYATHHCAVVEVRSIRHCDCLHAFEDIRAQLSQGTSIFAAHLQPSRDVLTAGSTTHSQVCARLFFTGPLNEFQHLAKFQFTHHLTFRLMFGSHCNICSAPHERLLCPCKVCGACSASQGCPPSSCITYCPALHPLQVKIGVLLRFTSHLYNLPYLKLSHFLGRMYLKLICDCDITDYFVKVSQCESEGLAHEAMRSYQAKSKFHLLGR